MRSVGTTVGEWTPERQFTDTVTSLWNGVTMTLSGPDWNRDLAAGATNGDVGFCATR